MGSPRASRPVFLGSLALATLLCAAPEDDPPALDFSKPALPAGWSVSSKSWKVVDGELRGEGSGFLSWTRPVTGDFTVTFTGWTEEKGSFEVKLLDAAGKKELYTFAFGGRFHPVLNGVMCCILKGDRFVARDPRHWIFPGRKFSFEVRAVRHQFQMFLNGELGPVFVDEEPSDDAAGYGVKIIAGVDGKKELIKIDNVKIERRRN